MKASLVWKGKMAFAATSESGHTLVLDASPDQEGNNQGPRPMELLLLSLGGCTGMDVISFLRKKRVAVDELKIAIEAERRKEHPQVFTKVTLDYQIKGKNLKESDVKWAVELSQEKYCSVIGMLKKTVPITYRWSIT